MGQLYLDKTNVAIYGPKAEAGWGVGISLIPGELRFAGGVKLCGVVAPSASVPSSPIEGDLYLFTGAGSNNWSGAAVQVRQYDWAIYTGTNWHVTRRLSGEMVFKGLVAGTDDEPASPFVGDVYVFNTEGTNSWGAGSRTVYTNSFAYYTSGGWYFDLGVTTHPLIYGGGAIDFASPPPTNALHGQLVGASGIATAQGVAIGWYAYEPILGGSLQEVRDGDLWVYDAREEVWYPLNNRQPATSAQMGDVFLATQAEVNTGTETSKAITPATLKGYVPSGSFPRLSRVYQTTVNLTASTWATITHNLNLSHPVVQTWETNGEQIYMGVRHSSANAVQVRSSVNLSNIVVTVTG